MSRPFDEAKYKALLEGLEISEIPFGFLNAELRFDAEYYKKAYLSLNDRVSKFGFQTVGSLATVTDGIHASIDFSESSKINLVSAMSPKENSFDLSRGGYISEKQHAENPRTALRKGDVVISTVGTIGNCAVVDDEILPANSDRHVGIVRILKDYSPYVLSTFILSKYGRFQTLMESTGNVQLSLFLYKIRDLKIPVFKQGFQLAIENCVRRALCISRQEKSFTAEAEAFLLSKLGLKDWKPSKKAFAQKTFADFKERGRLDAEYYQPKYDELKSIVEKHAKDIRTVSEIQAFNARGLQPDYDPEGTLNVINSKHILENGLDYGNFEKAIASDWAARPRAQVFRDDILIYTTGANIGRTAIYLNDEQALASNHVNILRVNVRNKIYVALVLNSIIGRLQTEQISTGSAQQELYPKDIEQFYIPFISDVGQDTISEKVLACFALRAESKRLLDLAKTAVETAIEQGEAAAMVLLAKDAALSSAE